jgi:hypothetical protein
VAIFASALPVLEGVSDARGLQASPPKTTEISAETNTADWIISRFFLGFIIKGPLIV